MFNFLEQRLPVAKWVEISVAWMTESFQDFFSFVQKYAENIMNLMKEILLFFPPLVLIILLTGVAIFLWKKKWKYPLLVFLGLLFIYNQGLWSELMNTLVLVGMSSLLSILIGIPLGILSAKSDQVEGILKPILDFMQTMPSFVYLIPAVAFFGIGIVPGVFASIIFSLPPTVRMNKFSIRQIPEELIEVSKSFGTTKMQQLCGIEFPLAKNTILAGINQSIMLALSMVVVTASMIGAPGLGRGVLEALQRAEVGKGFVNGFALVILAIVIDRFTQRFTSSELKKKAPKEKKRKMHLCFSFCTSYFSCLLSFSKQEKKEKKRSGNLKLCKLGH
ncbi:proline/glycine betaine ABC transporter permease [Fusobacterium necrophorum]|uniref:ABC transporter permease n=1 Tax=Fusobacterium necrophorum TaxID=859 RepID=UPI0030A28123